MEVHENMYYLIRYIAETTCEPRAREVYEGRNIGIYLQNIKKGRVKLSEEDRNFFERLGIKLHTENPQEKVHQKLLILVDFLKTHKRRPNINDYYKNIQLSVFLRNIQTGNTSLTKEDQELLDEALKLLPARTTRRTR